jgi:replicative DNA helicase
MNSNLKDQVLKIIADASDDHSLISLLKRWIFASDNAMNSARPSISIGNAISESIEGFSNSGKEGKCISSGFDGFDRELGGLTFGEFVVLGGRPGMGKTQWLVQLATQVSKNVPVLYFSFDHSLDALSLRFLSHLTGIDVGKLTRNDLNNEEKLLIEESESSFKEHKLFLNNSGYNSISVFSELCQKHIEEEGVKIIIVDYLQAMTSQRHRSNREMELSTILRGMKELARNNAVSVVASSQLSRAVETRGGDKRPQLSDLRESGAIEQDADKVLFLYRPEYYSILIDEDGNDASNYVDLIVAKNKQGKTGEIEMYRNESFTGYYSRASGRKHFNIDDQSKFFNE